MKLEHRHQLEIHVGNPAVREELLDRAAVHDLPKDLLEETVQVLAEKLRMQEEFVALEATQKDKLEKLAEEQRSFQAEVSASQDFFKNSSQTPIFRVSQATFQGPTPITINSTTESP